MTEPISRRLYISLLTNHMTARNPIRAKVYWLIQLSFEPTDRNPFKTARRGSLIKYLSTTCATPEFAIRKTHHYQFRFENLNEERLGQWWVLPYTAATGTTSYGESVHLCIYVSMRAFDVNEREYGLYCKREWRSHCSKHSNRQPMVGHIPPLSGNWRRNEHTASHNLLKGIWKEIEYDLLWKMASTALVRLRIVIL